jgi:hypothetical protein
MTHPQADLDCLSKKKEAKLDRGGRSEYKSPFSEIGHFLQSSHRGSI